MINPTFKIVIHTDGGSRGNPGPSAIGIVMEAFDLAGGKKLLWQKKFKEYIGEATNNIAEYRAMILALREARKAVNDNFEIPIEIRTDSELMYRQIIGVYKVRDANLKHLFSEVHELKDSFQNMHFAHIPRENNAIADALVNEALDGEI